MHPAANSSPWTVGLDEMISLPSSSASDDHDPGSIQQAGWLNSSLLSSFDLDLVDTCINSVSCVSLDVDCWRRPWWDEVSSWMPLLLSSETRFSSVCERMRQLSPNSDTFICTGFDWAINMVLGFNCPWANPFRWRKSIPLAIWQRTLASDGIRPVWYYRLQNCSSVAWNNSTAKYL